MHSAEKKETSRAIVTLRRVNEPVTVLWLRPESPVAARAESAN